MPVDSIVLIDFTDRPNRSLGKPMRNSFPAALVSFAKKGLNQQSHLNLAQSRGGFDCIFMVLDIYAASFVDQASLINSASVQM